MTYPWVLRLTVLDEYNIPSFEGAEGINTPAGAAITGSAVEGNIFSNLNKNARNGIGLGVLAFVLLGVLGIRYAIKKNTFGFKEFSLKEKVKEFKQRKAFSKKLEKGKIKVKKR